MKFRKKPVVIDAWQYDPTKIGEPLPDGVHQYAVGDNAYIDTLEGRMTVSPGDWVITGVKGEKYPCKPDIFLATYEAAE